MPDRPIRRALAGSRPRTRGGWLLALLCLLLTVVAVAGLVAHYRAPGRTYVLAVSAVAPYLMLAAPLAFVLLLLARCWVPALIALVLTALCAATQAPLYVAATPPAKAASLTVMTSNLRLGLANPTSVVAAVRRHQVDVLMLEELTPEEQSRLIAAGLDRLLPHHESAPSYAALGTGLWTRYPLTDAHRVGSFNFNFVVGRIHPSAVGRTVQLAATHMCGPYPVATCWHQDIAHLPSVLPSLTGHGPAILGGDFNATPDVKQFRALLTDGWADGADQAGAGYTRTYPSNRSFPPLIAIDHVLTNGAVATSAQTVEIPGSDHRALVVRVAVPAS